MSGEEKEGEGDDPIKPLFWITSSKDDLGFGGAGVLEIVEDDRGSTFRGVYTVKFAGAVYVLDAFQKKSKMGAKTPKEDIDRIKKRLQAAEEHYEQWRGSQQSREDNE